MKNGLRLLKTDYDGEKFVNTFILLLVLERFVLLQDPLKFFFVHLDIHSYILGSVKTSTVLRQTTFDLDYRGLTFHCSLRMESFIGRVGIHIFARQHSHFILLGATQRYLQVGSNGLQAQVCVCVECVCMYARAYVRTGVGLSVHACALYTSVCACICVYLCISWVFPYMCAYVRVHVYVNSSHLIVEI